MTVSSMCLCHMIVPNTSLPPWIALSALSMNGKHSQLYHVVWHCFLSWPCCCPCYSNFWEALYGYVVIHIKMKCLLQIKWLQYRHTVPLKFMECYSNIHSTPFNPISVNLYCNLYGFIWSICKNMLYTCMHDQPPLVCSLAHTNDNTGL